MRKRVKVFGFKKEEIFDESLWQCLHQGDAHSKSHIRIKIQHQIVLPGQVALPRPVGLPREAKILLLCKDQKAHGAYILLFELGNINRLFCGTGHQELTEEPYQYTLGPHKDCLIFNLTIGQFFYYPDSLEKCKLKGDSHHLKIISPAK